MLSCPHAGGRETIWPADSATHSAGRGPRVQVVTARTWRTHHCQLPLLDSAPLAGANLGLAGAEPGAAASRND